MSELETIDGGDRACGELLLVLAARTRVLPPGTRVRLLATDPAAPLDLPAWCHLTGHTFLGGGEHDGRPHYDVLTATSPRDVDPRQPWRLKPSVSVTVHYREENKP